ncbi:MAG: energy transducer TonB [Dysgonamonadaceae bacterium]|jgi:protein TonB|nr:energy transducer TonB [Dysgonamonadaceae bacterium]
MDFPSPKLIRVKTDSVIREEPAITCYDIAGEYEIVSVPEQEPIGGYTYAYVEQMPQFPGGNGALVKFIQENLQDPSPESCVQGRVVVRVIINSEGEVTHPEIVKSLEPAFDKEAIRVIQMMPRWTPGKQDGKNVNVYYTLPVLFRLQ